jgi:hypothetical protein
MADSTFITQLTVTFSDGTVQTYGLTESQGDATQMASRIKNIMESNFLALELDHKLLMLPIQNIRSIEVSPTPTKLPDTVLKHGVIIE